MRKNEKKFWTRVLLAAFVVAGLFTIPLIKADVCPVVPMTYVGTFHSDPGLTMTDFKIELVNDDTCIPLVTSCWIILECPYGSGTYNVSVPTYSWPIDPVDILTISKQGGPVFGSTFYNGIQSAPTNFIYKPLAYRGTN